LTSKPDPLDQVQPPAGRTARPALATWSFGPVFAIYDLSARAFHPELLAALMD
jgi:hypothetical protein